MFSRVWISWCVMSLIHEVNVQGIHELKGRKMGSTIHLNVHIEVLSVSYSLDIIWVIILLWMYSNRNGNGSWTHNLSGNSTTSMFIWFSSFSVTSNPKGSKPYHYIELIIIVVLSIFACKWIHGFVWVQPIILEM